MFFKVRYMSLKQRARCEKIFELRTLVLLIFELQNLTTPSATLRICIDFYCVSFMFNTDFSLAITVAESCFYLVYIEILHLGQVTLFPPSYHDHVYKS